MKGNALGLASQIVADKRESLCWGAAGVEKKGGTRSCSLFTLRGGLSDVAVS